ncbi:hypothetical protein G4Y79_02450 [Phototrophicus methaneseepsis]|uniref:Uncharacterized protein n=1 Tax=Phototrophicus methaneseepsis TaxID=2710758 RepID=A0A7S8EA86_9CHLR|nr:MJ0042-type zinc finger domain-containing protein [Phototrophicus methaneseepsis]QPC83257.1 hypothetical protein G4Y79_02450 [Phototrophicus methaneseepsis]
MQVVCPECGEQVPAENINIQQMVAVCPTCNAVFKFDLSQIKADHRKVKRPHQLTIHNEGDYLHMAFFTNFRLDKSESFIRSIALSIAFAFSTFATGMTAMEDNLSMAIPALFAVLTLSMVYAVALIVYNKTHIEMDDDVIRVSRRPLPDLSQAHEVSLFGVVAIRCAETKISKKNDYDTPRYRVWAEMADGSKKTIITDLTEDYAYYVARLLDEQLNDGLTSVDLSRLADEQNANQYVEHVEQKSANRQDMSVLLHT